MTDLLVLLTALLPVAALLIYILIRDKAKPEPAGQLAKAFALGLLSTLLSYTISLPSLYLGLFSDEVYSVTDAVRCAFFGAAIPEELAKLFVLWLALRKNKHFDEKMDGIVYAVFVSMGFAAAENILYLFSNYETFVEVGVLRGLFAVPAHFCCGILMGYYYSMAKFYPHAHKKNKVLVIAAPVLLHGAYDSILMVLDVPTGLGVVLLLVFFWGCFKMWQMALRKVKEHLERDADSAGINE